MDKKQLRQHIRLLKSQYSPQELEIFSQRIIQRLLSSPALHQASTVLMYYALPDEVNTHQALDILVEKGKTVLLPVVINDTEMELRCYSSPADLEMGFFNIMEPVGTLFTNYSDIDVAVVPGMAFDHRGNRLGRGKGYYDRFLSLLPNTYKIGVCFDFQKMPGVPADEHDIKMDMVI